MFNENSTYLIFILWNVTECVEIMHIKYGYKYLNHNWIQCLRSRSRVQEDNTFLYCG